MTPEMIPRPESASSASRKRRASVIVVRRSIGDRVRCYVAVVPVGMVARIVSAIVMSGRRRADPRRQARARVRAGPGLAKCRTRSWPRRFSTGQRQGRQERHAGARADHLDQRREARRAEAVFAGAGLRAEAQRLIAQAMAVVQQQHARAVQPSRWSPAACPSQRMIRRRRQHERIASQTSRARGRRRPTSSARIAPSSAPSFTCRTSALVRSSRPDAW